MTQAARFLSSWCPVRCDRMSTAGPIRAFHWTEPNIVLHRAGPLFGWARYVRGGLSFWNSGQRHLNTTTRGQRLPVRSFTQRIFTRHSSMASTPQSAHAAPQQQSQGALVWIDCEVLSASPFSLITHLSSSRSHLTHMHTIQVDDRP